MDWSQVAIATTTILTPLLPYLIKAGEKAAEEIGKKLGVAAWEKAKALYETIRAKFAGDAYAEETLRRVAEKPTDEGRRSALQSVLTEKAEADHDFGQQLARLVEEVQSSPGDTLTAIGSYIAQASHGSTAKVEIHGRESER